MTAETGSDSKSIKRTEQYIRASDLCIGWVFPSLGENGGRSVVMVLPKPWLPQSELGTMGMLRRWPAQGETLKFYYCYQGEVLACGDNASDNSVSEVLRQLYQYAIAESRGRPDRELEELAADEGMTLADIRATRRLFSSSRKPAQPTKPPAKTDPIPTSTTGPADKTGTRETGIGRDLQAALIRLLDTARPREWLNALAFQPDPLFREVIARHYVEVLKPLVPHMRRGYVERRERLTSPRGRVVASSAGRSEASSEPAIICDYSDFEKDLPLHRVLVSALHEAIGVLSAHAESSEHLLEACGLRHRLEGIASYLRPLARSTARQLRLTPAQLKWWQGPMQLARAVLNEWSPTDSDDQSDDTPDLTIPSASLWERVISKALRAGGMVTLGDDRDVEDWNAARRISPPWPLANARTFRCDIVVELHAGPRSNHVILDAKYSSLLPYRQTGRPIVPVAHIRQVFAYGVLWHPKDRSESRASLSPRDVGLVYLRTASAGEGSEGIEKILCTKEEDRAQGQPVGYEGPGFGGNDSASPGWPGLYVLAMAFPSPDDCGSEARLHAFYDGRGKDWNDLLQKRPN